MHLVAILLLGLTNLSGGSTPGQTAKAPGDSQSGAVVAAAGQLLDMAGLLFNDGAAPPESLEALTNSLNNLTPRGEGEDLPGLPSAGDPDRHEAFASAMRTLHDVVAAGMPRDTVRSSFRGLFYAFHNLYSEELQNVFLRDSGVTLVLFSASITCDCTRKLSDSYTRQIVQAKDMLENFPPVLVLDCAADPGLMDRYGIETLPTILILEGNDKEFARLSEKEFILPGLVGHLQSRNQENLK
jgi:hypothetical protein